MGGQNFGSAEISFVIISEDSHFVKGNVMFF